MATYERNAVATDAREPALERLTACANTIRAFLENLEQIADRVFGDEPPSAENRELVAVPNGQIGQLTYNLQNIEHRVGRVRDRFNGLA